LPPSVKEGSISLSEPSIIRRFEAAFSRPLPGDGIPFEELMMKAEKEFIIKAMRESGGNQSKASRMLQLNRDKLRYRLKNFDLDRE
ncbi:MAG: sigma-54-dependent Fis family transcriptional regulator, partial [Candidatus Krumholzibacteria bacterium]|nr:sigma-54-dependent Fis family transcriptional regulator [Candidatus Krumholzibacteria bacterium]